MRCPKCHKKAHPDDIYCVFCSASLRGRSPEDPWNCVCADEETHRRHRPRKPTRRSRRPKGFVIVALVLALTFLPTLLAGIFYTTKTIVDDFHTLTVAPEPVAPEDAWKLGTVIARWDGFTVTAEYISMDEITGELQLICTAENQTDYTIATSDAAITAEGYDLAHLLYMELAPGEKRTDYLWIDTAALQAEDISHLGELTFSLHLSETDHDTLLAVTDPVTLALDFSLPKISMHKADTTLIETEDLTVTLTGWQTEPEYGELTLYTRMENRSDENCTVLMEDAFCAETDLHLFAYYDVPAHSTLLCWDMLYDVAYSETDPTEIRFRSQIQDARFSVTATGETVIHLDPNGLSGEIRSEWE